MFFEIYQDIVPLLFIMSVYMTASGVRLLHFSAKKTAIGSISREQQKLDVLSRSSIDNTSMLASRTERKAWITRLMKRKEAPEDDTDNQILSITKEVKETRGGLLWEKTLYSPASKGINF